MLKTEALKFFGSKMAIARALGVKRQAIQGWGEVVPIRRAFVLQDLSRGKLKVKPELYREQRQTL